MSEPSETPMLARDYLESPRKLIRRSLRHLWVVVPVVVVGAIATIAALRVRLPQFQSQAVLYYQEGLQWSGGGSEGIGGRKLGGRLKELLLARARLQKLIDDLDLYPALVKQGKIGDAVEQMRGDVSFKQGEGDTFVISYTGARPDTVQQVTSKLTETLIEENTRLRAEQAEVAKGFLDAEKKRNEEDLHSREQELVRFLARHPEFAAEMTAPSAGVAGAAVRATKRAGAADAPAAAGDVLTTLRREEDRLKHQIANPGDVRHGAQDPALVAAKNDAEARLASARRDLADKKARFTDQHPDVRAADAAVRSAEAAVTRATDALNGKAGGGGDVVEIEPRAALEARLAQVQEEIRDAQRRPKPGDSTAAAPAPATDAAQRIVATETEWSHLNRQVAEARERFQQLDSRQFVATMAASSLSSGQAAQFVIVDPAFLPSKPVGLSNTRMLAFGVAGAVGLGLVIALLLGALDDRILDARDVDALGMAPALIEVPLGRLAGKRGRRG
jgi:uncharacterized protein involved in exopolysaccharide biosynthesis